MNDALLIALVGTVGPVGTLGLGWLAYRRQRARDVQKNTSEARLAARDSATAVVAAYEKLVNDLQDEVSRVHREREDDRKRCNEELTGLRDEMNEQRALAAEREQALHVRVWNLERELRGPHAQ